MDEYRQYLGDGVYAHWDGFQVWVAAERDGRQHAVALEAPVLDALETYVAQLRARGVPA